MKILVTGGAGFIGSHLCSHLIFKGHQVTCLDNLFTGSIANIKHLIDLKGFRFITHDVITPLYFPPGEFDQIYHLACPASPKAYQKDPLRTIATCFDGTRNVLEYARQTDTRVLFTSTSEIYGDPTAFPQNELYRGNVNTIGPRSCYDEGKRIAETLMMEYHNEHKVDIRIARIFNTYGPNMQRDDGRAVSNFINRCLSGEDMELYGDGTQTRSFCYVSDTVEGLMLLMASTYIYPVNIGNDHEITIVHLATQIKQLLPSSRPNVAYAKLPMDDPVRRCPDLTIARHLLDWEPTIDLETGLKQTISYFQSLGT